MNIIPVRQWNEAKLRGLLEMAAGQVQNLASPSNTTVDVLNTNDILYGPGTAPGYGGSNTATLTNPNAPTANTWLTDQFPDFTNTQNTAFVVTGFESEDPIPHLRALRFWKGNVPLAYLPLDDIYGWPESSGYFSAPLFYGNTEHCIIDLLFDQAIGANASTMRFKGYVGRPDGTLTSSQGNNTLGQLIGSGALTP